MSDAAVQVVSVFRQTDRDGNGYLSEDELLEVLSELDPGKWNKEKVGKLVAAIDTSHDGLIQYDEFVAFLFGKSSACQGARKILTKAGANYNGNGLKVVKPAEILPDPEEASGRIRHSAKYGRIIVFFDVDGVLNTTAEFQSSSEEEEEEEEKENDETNGKDEPEAIRKKESDDMLTDSRGRWAARLSRKCLERLRLVLASFDENDTKDVLGEADGVAGEDAAQGNRVRLVLTSTWRMSEEQTAFIRWALIEAGIPERLFYGTTACLAGATRGEEVLHFLGELAVLRHEVAAWIVLDSDEDNLFALPELHRAHVWEVAGFNIEVANQARSILASQDMAWSSLRGLPGPTYPADFKLGHKKKDAQKPAEKRGRRRSKEPTGDWDEDAGGSHSKSPQPGARASGVVHRRGSKASAMAATGGRRMSESPKQRRRSLSPSPHSPATPDQPPMASSLSRQASKNSSPRPGRRRSEVPQSRPSSHQRSLPSPHSPVTPDQPPMASSLSRQASKNSSPRPGRRRSEVPQSRPSSHQGSLQQASEDTDGMPTRRRSAERTDEDASRRTVSSSRSARRRSLGAAGNPQEPISRVRTIRADERPNRGGLLAVPSPGGESSSSSRSPIRRQSLERSKRSIEE